MPSGSRGKQCELVCLSPPKLMAEWSFTTKAGIQRVRTSCFTVRFQTLNSHDCIGLLLDNAQDLLKQPALTDDDLYRRFMVTVRDAHRHGLTSIHDAGLDPISLAFFNK